MSKLNLLKMIDLKPSNTIWMCYKCYICVISPTRNKLHEINRYKRFFFAPNCVKIRAFCVSGTNFQFYRSTWWDFTHWGRVTHICVGKLTTIGSDNGLSPGRHQAIIWTIAGILLIGPFGTNFSETLIGIQTFSFKKMHLKMSSAKWCLFVSASMC